MGTAGAGTKLRALVVGGAVGGLTTAIALRRAGVDVSVFEQSADARVTAGRWGLGLWTNAVRTLQQLGLAEGVLAAGPQTEELRFQTAEGKHLATWPIGDLGRKLGAPSCSISPDALLGVLTTALDDDSVVQRSAKVEGFTQDPDGVTLRLADGREERGDFLVGADGLRSTIRTQILGESAPRYSGYWVWQSIIDFEHEGAPIGIDQLLWGRGARFAFHHVEHNKLFWQVIINTPEAGDGVTSGRRENLVNRFDGWRAPVQEAIAATPEEEIRGLPIYDREPSDQWGIGRATLLGDAAHPMTNNLGQGACMAIEDALLLARTVSTTPDDVHGALRRYEQARMDRTKTMVKLARQIGEFGTWQNPALVAVRDQVIRRTFAGPVWKSNLKLLSYQV